MVTLHSSQQRKQTSQKHNLAMKTKLQPASFLRQFAEEFASGGLALDLTTHLLTTLRVAIPYRSRWADTDHCPWNSVNDLADSRGVTR
jgi:hypothetical protein